MKCFYFLVLSALFAACSSGWSDEEKKSYLDSCNRTSKGQKEYCDCTLEKVMKEAPNPKDAEKVDVDKIANGCLDKIKY